jgi:two-component system chemotaxis response regulator CheB
MSSTPINVLIVDDSALMRNLIGRIVENEPGLAVVAKAMNGMFALKKLETSEVDVIILDLEMPEMNGIEFLKKRKELKIEVPVIILSSIARRGAEVTMEALALGAADFIKKPSGSVSEDIHVVGEHLVGLIKAYGGRRKAHGAPALSPTRSELPPTHPTSASTLAPPAPPVSPFPPARPVTLPSGVLRPHAGLQLCVIGISTGGPNALRQVFAALDADFPLPILVVQHMPAGFTAEFARSLDKSSPLEVKEAEEGDLVKKGRILIAPGDWHIEVERRSLAAIIHVNQNDQCNGHRPSAGVLFKSAAKHYGSGVLAVIMTGMGRDGSAEIGEIYKAGGLTLSQDEATSVVFGMPKVAIEMGHVEKVVPLNEMAATLNKLAKEFSR